MVPGLVHNNLNKGTINMQTQTLEFRLEKAKETSKKCCLSNILKSSIFDQDHTKVMVITNCCFTGQQTNVILTGGDLYRRRV